MLSTGVRTPLGIKVSGARIEEIGRISQQIAGALRSAPATRSAFVDPVGEGSFLDVKWNRVALARAGVSIEDAQAAVEYAVGGRNVTSVIRGRERYPVNVRYAQAFSADAPTLAQVLVFGERVQRRVPIGDLADIEPAAGPVMLRNDDGMLTGYLYVDIEGTDNLGYISEAERRIRETVMFPPGYSFSWTGQYESILSTRRQLASIIPLTIVIIVVLLYMSTKSLSRTLFVLLAVPFSAVGAVWAVYLLGYHLSLAVWVGVIALLGIDAETGVFMLLYLDQAYDRLKAGDRSSRPDVERAVIEGAARRVRPKLMTVLTMLIGLLPIMWSNGTGAEVMKHIAAPVIGGVFTSFVLELAVYPMLYFRWRSRGLGSAPAPA
jgi:Cu(I)/Ag(I) efflux system membrane protein CusA/SilA